MSINEKRTKNGLKRFLKRFPQYKSVDNIDDADVAMIYLVVNTEKFIVLEINSSAKEKLKNITEESLRIFYLKHKNPRNKKQIIGNDINRKYYKAER